MRDTDKVIANGIIRLSGIVRYTIPLDDIMHSHYLNPSISLLNNKVSLSLKQPHLPKNNENVKPHAAPHMQ